MRSDSTRSPSVWEKVISDEVWSLTARLGCIDLVRSGVSTINDIWYCPDGLARAVDQIGLRAVIANKVFDVRAREPPGE